MLRVSVGDVGGAPAAGAEVFGSFETAERQLTLRKPLREAKLGLQLHCDSFGSVTVLGVAPGSLAAEAGLVVGERLLEVGGVEVHSTEQALSLYLPCTFPVPSLYLPCTFW